MKGQKQEDRVVFDGGEVKGQSWTWRGSFFNARDGGGNLPFSPYSSLPHGLPDKWIRGGKKGKAKCDGVGRRWYYTALYTFIPTSTAKPF